MALAEDIDSSLIGDDSDDQIDWEEIQVPQEQHIEITLSAHPKLDTIAKKKGPSHAERLIRLDAHKIHTVCLLANAWIRNKWINDQLLHARLLSLTPLPLQNAFAVIHKSRVPDQNQRGRLFESAISHLTTWWADEFFDVSRDGHIRNRTFEDVQEVNMVLGLGHVPDAALDLEAVQDALDDDGETIRSPNSLMKHALMQSGSRDVSAQLFTALCRALGIPARLVVSLQSVPWQTGVGKPKPKYKKATKIKAKPNGKGKEREKDKSVEARSGDDDDMEVVEIPTPSSGAFPGEGQQLNAKPTIRESANVKGKEKEKPKPDVKLRKTKSKGNVLGQPSKSPSASGSKRLASPDPTTTPPVFWTEVFSRADARWLPIDPIRGIVNKRKVFDPSPSPSSSAATPSIYPPSHPLASTPSAKTMPRPTRMENRMAYVLAFEEDGYARDVTRRYAREFGAKIVKLQNATLSSAGGGGRGRKVWWERVLSIVRRPYRLHRDDLEDEELELNQLMEGMPTTMSGFKDHPLYVLTRHLKQSQTLHPAPPETAELGKFRGEPVYPRSAVVSLKTAENWMRSEGRRVKEGSQALKWVKMRAGTVSKLREIEVLKDGMKGSGDIKQDGPDTRGVADGEVMQGLYARSQTEVYVPDPIVNGKVPKNNFGNIDMYVPSMLPAGGVHVPYKGIAKIARKLGFDHAEAVTGFEFKKRKAFPITEGVVVAAENESALLEAYWAAERDAEETARFKRQDRVVKRWTRLIHGLRIRQRLQEQYAARPGQEVEQLVTAGTTSDAEHGTGLEEMTHVGGGFLVGADDVVQRYQLPKDHHPIVPVSSPSLTGGDTLINNLDASEPLNLETMDVDSDTEEIFPIARIEGSSKPKTMVELAEEDAARNISDTKRLAEQDSATRYQPSSSTIRVSGAQSPAVKSVSRGRSTPAVKTKTKNKAGPQSSRRTSRKRVKADSDSLPEIEDRRSPTKRKAAVMLASPPPTRTLRPRVPRSLAKLQEEQDKEEAYRRAVAQ